MKLEINLKQAELMLELLERETIRLDNKLRDLKRSIKLHLTLCDLETVARIEARIERLTQLELEAYELHEVIYWAQYGRKPPRELTSSHTGTELAEALELHNQKS